MTGSDTRSPPVLFRAATLLGCVALLLGVAGVFYFGGRDRSWRETLPRDAATVLLRGVEDHTDLRVEVLWWDAEGVRRTETGTAGSNPGFLVFREAPEALPLTLRVLRGASKVIHEQHAIFTLGGGFEVVVRED